MGLGRFLPGLERCARSGIRSNHQRPSDGRDPRITRPRAAFTHVRAETSHLEGQSGVTGIQENQNGRRDADAPQLAKDVECTGGRVANAQNDEIEGRLACAQQTTSGVSYGLNVMPGAE